MNQNEQSWPVFACRRRGQDMESGPTSLLPTFVETYSRLRRSTNISHYCQDRRLQCGNAAAIFLAYYAAMPHNP